MGIVSVRHTGLWSDQLVVIGDGNTRPQRIPPNKLKDHKTHKETGRPRASRNCNSKRHTLQQLSRLETEVCPQCLKKSKRVWASGIRFPWSLNQPSAVCSEVRGLRLPPLLSPQVLSLVEAPEGDLRTKKGSGSSCLLCVT